jgi:recombinational DNA repair ATPase RecF
MHIRRIHLREYKRFTELTVDLPRPARLVMMCGPNGSGKSSLLEAMKLWHDVHSNDLGRSGDTGGDRENVLRSDHGNSPGVSV